MTETAGLSSAIDVDIHCTTKIAGLSYWWRRTSHDRSSWPQLSDWCGHTSNDRQLASAKLLMWTYITWQRQLASATDVDIHHMTDSLPQLLMWTYITWQRQLASAQLLMWTYITRQRQLASAQLLMWTYITRQTACLSSAIDVDIHHMTETACLSQLTMLTELILHSVSYCHLAVSADQWSSMSSYVNKGTTNNEKNTQRSTWQNNIKSLFTKWNTAFLSTCYLEGTPNRSEHTMLSLLVHYLKYHDTHISCTLPQVSWYTYLMYTA